MDSDNSDAATYAETDLPFVTFRWSPLRSITTPRWKYVLTARPELYDRTTDPEERHDLIAALPDVARDLDARLRALEAAMPARSQRHGEALSAADRRRLEALGYLVESAMPSAPAPSAGLRDIAGRRDIKDMLAIKHIAARLQRAVNAGGLETDTVIEGYRRLAQASPETPRFYHLL